jgi:hypothetical protein
LESKRRARTIERHPVGAESDDGHNPRPMSPNLARQPSPPRAQLVLVQFSGRRGCPRDEIRDTTAKVEKFLLLPWEEPPRGEPCREQGRPETVAWPGKVMTGRRCVETWIDTAEKDGSCIARRASIIGCWLVRSHPSNGRSRSTVTTITTANPIVNATAAGERRVFDNPAW